jgi:hypothetical protein
MDPNENTMQILHVMKTGNHMNTLEKFCIYKENNRNNQINEERITTENKIFDTIIRYGTPYIVIFIVVPCILKSKVSHSPTDALFITLWHHIT